MQTVILDFDGVIHGYDSGWRGIDVVPDPPVPGAREAIKKLRENYRVVVYSTRCSNKKGIKAIERYLDEHDIIVDAVVDRKVPASISIDDRGFRFEGDWDAVVELLQDSNNLVPWNKKRS